MRGAALCLILSTSLLAGSASAQTRALWVARGLPDEQERELAGAISESTNLELLTPVELVDSLRQMAALMGPDDAIVAAEDARQRAREAYVELRLGEAQAAFDEAQSALLSSERAAVRADQFAELWFERGLTFLAAQRRDEAEACFVRTLSLQPSFAPDRAVYGTPVFHALVRAGNVPRTEVELSVDRAPSDAVVLVNGQEVLPGQTIRVRGGDYHLITGERLGYQPRSIWMEVPASGRANHAIVLPRAAGGLLAEQAIASWDEASLGEFDVGSLSGDVAVVVARAADLTSLFLARPTPEGVKVVLTNAETGHLVREATGERLRWEVRPYFVLAEALAGRVVTPPTEAELASVSLSVTAPERVQPGDPITLRFSLRDPSLLVKHVRVTCEEATASMTLNEDTNRAALALAVDAPTRAGTVDCAVRGLDDQDRVLVEAPPAGENLFVRVAEGEDGRVPWYVWASGAAAVVAGVVTAAVLAGREPERILVINAQ